MAISGFDRAPLGVTLSHVAPSGATHSSAFHTIRSCFVNNQIVQNNVKVHVEVYNTAQDYAIEEHHKKWHSNTKRRHSNSSI